MEVIDANDAADLQAMAGAISFVDTPRSDAVKGPSMVAFVELGRFRSLRTRFDFWSGTFWRL